MALHPPHRRLLVLLVVALAALAGPASALGRARLDTRVFAPIGPPGHPEPVAVGPDGLVYVGTNRGIAPGPFSRSPSRIFVLDRRGRPVRQEVLRGQELDEEHGIQGLAFDGSGLLYVLDRAAVRPRVVVIDPTTGRQRDYASFADVPLCRRGRRTGCSAGAQDRRAGPDYAAFAPDGTLYVTDIEQGLIWRVPRGGGRARVWFTDPILDNPSGPNGIQLRADGRTLLFAQTISAAPRDRAAGLLLELPIRRDGRPGRLRRFWTSRPVDAVDGFAIARSGHVYAALAVGDALVRISPAGRELQRFPPTPAANAGLPRPFDAPASLAFLGRRLLVSNQSYLRSDPRSWAVLDVWAGEAGLPLFRPVVAPPAQRPRLTLTVAPLAAPDGAVRRVSFRATVGRGVRQRAVAGARVAVAGRVVRTGRTGRASVRLRLSSTSGYPARASARGLRGARARVPVTALTG